jgi:hypothetical protein
MGILPWYPPHHSPPQQGMVSRGKSSLSLSEPFDEPLKPGISGCGLVCPQAIMLQGSLGMDTGEGFNTSWKVSSSEQASL